MPINANLIAGLEPTPQYDPIANFSKIEGVKNLIQQGQIGQQQISQNAQRLQQEQQAMVKSQRIESDTQKFGQIYSQVGGDPEKAVQLGTAAGIHPDVLDKFQKEITDLAVKKAQIGKDTSEANKNNAAAAGDNLKLEQGRNSQLLDLVDQYQQIPPDQQAAAWPTILQRAMQIDPKTAEHFNANQVPTNQSLAPIRAGLVTHDYILKQAKAKQEADEAAQKATAAADTHADELTKQPVAKAVAAATLADPKLLNPEQRQTADNAQAKFDQELTDFAEKVRHNKADERETQRYHELSTEGVQLTPEAEGKMAEMFATTGVLPALGQGKQAAQARSRIINAAATNFPQVDFASNKAAYQANTSSLKKLQTTSDQVDGFEKTAGKNIDVFLKAAGNVVDSGSPALNVPLRAISDKVLGSEAMSAFKTARETALTEAAKVLENSTGAGGVTVSGRESVKTLSDPNATLGQQVAAMKVLRQDMANRKQSNGEQIKAIQDRIGARGPTADATPAATHTYNPATGKIEAIK